MNAREYLERVKHHEAVIRNLQQTKEDLKGTLYSLGGSSYDVKVQTSKSVDRIGDIYAKIDEKEQELAKKIEEHIEFKTKVVNEINALSESTLITVLYERYINGKCWEKVSEDIGYSWAQTHRMHKNALAEFEKVHADMLKIAK